MFRVLNTCWRPIVMAITLWTRVCIFVRFSFSEAKRDSAPVVAKSNKSEGLIRELTSKIEKTKQRLALLQEKLKAIDSLI